MPQPGSHQYDIQRTRTRAEYDDQGVPDQHADRAANEQLERDAPPRPVGDPDRAAGPRGTRGTSRGDPSITDPPRPLASGMELRSSAFNDGAFIPDRYATGRDNISPPLEWTHVPDGTQELVLLCEDPDAPGGTFVHWVLTGIRPDTTGVPEGEPPEGANAGVNDFGQVGWGGPHPPVGDEPHRYFFRLYATDRPLELGGSVDAAAVRTALEGHVIDTGTLVGRFGR